MEEAKDFLYSIAGNLGLIYVEDYTSKDGEKMREAIKALDKEPCVDAVSRAEAKKLAWDLELETCYDNEKVVEMLDDLPSVTPKGNG